MPNAPDPGSSFTATSFTPVRLTDGVLADLSEAILGGRLAPGAKLVAEAKLAASYGVSKQVVREAIRQLAAIGVVEIAQGRATRVRAMDAAPLGRFWRFAVGGSAQSLAEAVELRRTIEPPIARMAAERHTAREADELERILARMRAALMDIPAWISADLAFHEHLALMTHNRLLLLQVRGMAPVIREVMNRFNARAPRPPAAWEETFARHERVAGAISARDGPAAEAAMGAHFAAADQAIRELFPDGAAASRAESKQKNGAAKRKR